MTRVVRSPATASSSAHADRVAVATRAAVDRFNDAFAHRDLRALAECLTDDTVFENTNPAPDGTRIEGKDAVLAFWARWFRANEGASLDTEEVVVSGDRAVVRWVYRKLRDGGPWHLRGVDLYTVRDGRISVKLSYVKG
jgi:ketosteroid isomerase-like protein